MTLWQAAISAQRRDDAADPLDAPDRVAVLQARPLHAQLDVVGLGEVGAAQDTVPGLRQHGREAPFPDPCRATRNGANPPFADMAVTDSCTL
jgi:hypothetical protein